MKKTFTILFLSISLFTLAQTQIANADFETWTGSGATIEPTSWNSNKTGTGLASSGPQTCYQETTVPHGGASCVRVETKFYVIAVVNGNVTSGVVNAPSSNKLEGYLSAAGSNANKMSFTGRPDSLTGWYKYTQATGGTGATAEQGKVRAILHTGGYYDPETPYNGNHADSSVNKIGEALFLTPQSNTTSWKRFSVPFTYVNGITPTYIMVNVTSSNNQTTVAPNSSSTGSKLWLDDLVAIYNPSGIKETEKNNFKVYCYDKTMYVDFSSIIDEQATLNVLDLTGKIIFSQLLDKDKMNILHLPASLNTGMYLYQIVGSETQKSGKFIVE